MDPWQDREREALVLGEILTAPPSARAAMFLLLFEPLRKADIAKRLKVRSPYVSKVARQCVRQLEGVVKQWGREVTAGEALSGDMAQRRVQLGLPATRAFRMGTPPRPVNWDRLRALCRGQVDEQERQDLLRLAVGYGQWNDAMLEVLLEERRSETDAPEASPNDHPKASGTGPQGASDGSKAAARTRGPHARSSPSDWLGQQVEAYRRVRPRYVKCAEVLRDVLENAAARLVPSATVQSRVKSVPGFAEKILRKRGAYPDPLHQLTDLCGARVITQTKEGVQRIGRFIHEHFEIDQADSFDAADGLRSTDAGYRPAHYVVRFKRGAFPTEIVSFTIPEEVYGLKAEIQVRTILQHAWAEVGHDRVFKNTFNVPDQYQRESTQAAAMLENADRMLQRLVCEADAYRTHYGASMNRDQMLRELAILEAVYQYDATNESLVQHIARLSICLGDWDRAIRFVEDFSEAPSAPLLTCLGLAYCRQYQDDRAGAGYRKGRGHLERAVRQCRREGKGRPQRLEAMTLLGDAWMGIDDQQALRWYREAFEVDPGDPRAVAGYLTLKVAEEKNAALASMFSFYPNLQAAIARCRQLVEIGINVPAAWFHLGQFLALLSRPDESLAAYCKACSLATGEHLLDEALRPIEKLTVVGQSLPHLPWIARLLLLAKAAKFPKEGGKTPLADLVTRSDPEGPARPSDYQVPSPVVIVAGGCDAAVEEQMLGYRDLLAAAFQGFQGAIVSGGTTAGISGLVGELGEVYPGQFRAVIGYMPKLTPTDVAEDTRYTHLRRTQGIDFTALEPIQSWIDLIASGIAPSEVKVLGINGGPIAAFEYRLALAMGAQVGVLEDSGREADRLIHDPQWAAAEGLARLPHDPRILNTFIHYGGHALLASDQIETVARAIHDQYRADQHDRFLQAEPAMADWDELLDPFKESNRQQAIHVGQKLEAIGMKALPVADREIQLAKFTEEQVERLAEMEHARWNVERRLAGWTLGPRDPQRKTSPYLVGWAELPETVKQWNRRAVCAIPALLGGVGLEIEPR